MRSSKIKGMNGDLVETVEEHFRSLFVPRGPVFAAMARNALNQHGTSGVAIANLELLAAVNPLLEDPQLADAFHALPAPRSREAILLPVERKAFYFSVSASLRGLNSSQAKQQMISSLIREGNDTIVDSEAISHHPALIRAELTAAAIIGFRVRGNHMNWDHIRTWSDLPDERFVPLPLPPGAVRFRRPSRFKGYAFTLLDRPFEVEQAPETLRAALQELQLQGPFEYVAIRVETPTREDVFAVLEYADRSWGVATIDPHLNLSNDTARAVIHEIHTFADRMSSMVRFDLSATIEPPSLSP